MLNGQAKKCKEFYKNTKLVTKILLDDAPFLLGQSQKWQSRDLAIFSEPNMYELYEYYAYSPHIEKLNDLDHIMKRISSLMLLYNGAQNIDFLNLEYKINGIAVIREPLFEKNLFALDIEKYPFCNDEKFYSIKCILESYSFEPSFGNVLFDMSKVDYNIRTILFLAGLIKNTNFFEDRILAWSTLYKIYDSIKYLCEKLEIRTDELMPNGKIEAFTAACNNMSILGLESRHGLSSRKKPKNVIKDLDEAIKLVLCLSKKCLSQYLCKEYKICFKGLECLAP